MKINRKIGKKSTSIDDEILTKLFSIFSVPINLRDFVYCIGIQNGTNDDLINFWERFLKINYHTEKILMMDALTCSDDSSFIKK